jgi:hypothetical protein
MFLVGATKMEDYFKNDLPLGSFYETVNLPVVVNPFSKICFNDVAILNNEYKKKEFYKNNLRKILNPKNGISHVFQSLFLLPYPLFTGIGIIHGGGPMLKKNYFYLWDKYYDIFHNTCLHKFRNYDLDINQYVIKDYQYLSGNFYVRDNKFVKLINVKGWEQLSLIKNGLKGTVNKELCVNDELDDSDESYEIIKEIQIMFQKKFPEKCSFEK